MAFRYVLSLRAVIGRSSFGPAWNYGMKRPDMEWLSRGMVKPGKKQKQQKPPSKKKKQQKQRKPQRAPKVLDPKIETKTALCLKLLEPVPESRTSSMTKEELAEAAQKAKEYSRKKMRQHRVWQSDMAAKEWLVREAIQSLPPNLREEAVKEDTTPIPMRLPFPTDTPPKQWT